MLATVSEYRDLDMGLRQCLAVHCATPLIIMCLYYFISVKVMK